ncbi:hypothetical protein [Geobacter grbiciae]|uniref:hypothetical protein n=1 Tax=Geobacter grbiciae TaxID=155042 RepID=UPI001C00B31F|nr:hypothetical protein [Geobacter grbiciae]MBT1077185.1 hypothetical protein [Geobacter grbiciae]
MRRRLLSALVTILVAQAAIAAEPVGLNKFYAKIPAPSLDSSTKLDVVKDLKPAAPAEGQDQKAVAGDEAKTEEERPIGVGSIASDVGHAVAVFFSSAVNVANVLRKVFGP